MPSASKSSKALKAYCAAKEGVSKALEAYSDAKNDVEKKRRCLLRFRTVVIRSKADLKVVMELKESNRHWVVKVKVPTKYKAKGRANPSERRLTELAHKNETQFVPRRVRRG